MTEIVERAVQDLVPYARNPRKNDAVMDQMAASIRGFGFKVPILALSDGTIVDGHLRLKAAQKLRIETVPVVLRTISRGVAPSCTPNRLRNRSGSFYARRGKPRSPGLWEAPGI